MDDAQTCSEIKTRGRLTCVFSAVQRKTSSVFYIYIYLFLNLNVCVGGFLEEDTHEQEVMTILKGRSFGFLSLVLQ